MSGQGGVSALLWTMNNPPLEKWFGITPPLPIVADADIGINGGEMLELGDLPPVENRPQWFIDMGWETVGRPRSQRGGRMGWRMIRSVMSNAPCSGCTLRLAIMVD